MINIQSSSDYKTTLLTFKKVV